MKEALRGLLDSVQRRLDFDWPAARAHPQFRDSRGLGRVALAGFGLGAVFGVHATLLVYTLATSGVGGKTWLVRWSLYAASLAGFHFLEFLATALYNPATATYDCTCSIRAESIRDPRPIQTIHPPSLHPPTEPQPSSSTTPGPTPPPRSPRGPNSGWSSSSSPTPRHSGPGGASAGPCSSWEHSCCSRAKRAASWRCTPAASTSRTSCRRSGRRATGS